MMDSVVNTFLSCATGALFTALVATIKSRNRILKLLSDGVLALLHYRLYAECERIIAAGSYTKGDLEDLTHLYGAYHALGGNGTGTKLYQTAIGQKLEVKNED